MNVEIQINNNAAPIARFVTWAASPCRIRVTNPAGITGTTVPVRLDRQGPATGGGIEFANAAAGPFAATLNISLPRNGTTVGFFVRGVFGKARTANGDVTIRVQASLTPPAFQSVATVPLMVRIRKNANTLSTAERNQVVSAFAQLNNQGLGRFVDFRDMHVLAADLEEHTRPGFLAWHRAYLLDLERELQAIDPSVALPYWRFDRAAPNIFKKDFLGESDNNGTVELQFPPIRSSSGRRITGCGTLPHTSVSCEFRASQPDERSADSCPRYTICQFPFDERAARTDSPIRVSEAASISKRNGRA